MRKILSIISVSTFCAIFLLFLGCAKNDSGYDKVISEIRDNVYVSSVDEWSFSAVSGEREKNYKIDGVANGRDEFFILTVEGYFASAPTCSFTINDKTYSGIMKKHPFNNSYSYEINVKNNSSEVHVSLQCANDSVQTTLKSVKTEQTKTYSQAFSKAKKELETTLKSHLKNGVFNGEVYIRLISNPTQDDGKYFWYVAFYKSESECYSVLIDSESGDVVALKGA